MRLIGMFIGGAIAGLGLFLLNHYQQNTQTFAYRLHAWLGNTDVTNNVDLDRWLGWCLLIGGGLVFLYNCVDDIFPPEKEEKSEPKS